MVRIYHQPKDGETIVLSTFLHGNSLGISLGVLFLGSGVNDEGIMTILVHSVVVTKPSPYIKANKSIRVR